MHILVSHFLLFFVVLPLESSTTIVGSNAQGSSYLTMTGNDPQPCITIAHIASPLIRSHQPGHHPSPFVRSRSALRLLDEAIQMAVSECADAIVITGSVISAAPPLRVCDSNFYYPTDPEPALSEAEADYCAIKSLLEASGLPYAITPGNLSNRMSHAHPRSRLTNLPMPPIPLRQAARIASPPLPASSVLSQASTIATPLPAPAPSVRPRG